MNEFLKRHSTRIIAKTKANPLPTDTLNAIIEKANQRTFYACLNRHLIPAKICQSPQKYPQVVVGDKTFFISWQTAIDIANGRKTTISL